MVQKQEYLSNYIKSLSKDRVILDMIKDMDNNWNLRKAYPNTEQYMSIPGAHNTQKWLQAIKEVYYDEQQGMNRQQALRKVTSNWNVTEVYDFLNWLRFYEEGTHLKYKKAQFYYGNADVGYLLPVKQDPVEKPSTTQQDIDFSKDSIIADEVSNTEKKRIIEKQRNKIIGRLDSTEKLLRTYEGQLFADKEFESLLESIYNLKKKVQLLNKRSTSTKLYDDLIVREANVLSRNGFVKAAEVIYSLSQDNGQSAQLGQQTAAKPMTKAPATPEAPVPPKKIPLSMPPAPPSEGSGSAGGLPAATTNLGAPSGPQTQEGVNNSPDLTESKDKSKGVSKFLENLDPDKNVSQDDVLEVFDDELFVVEAQAVPEIPLPPPISKESPKPIAPIAHIAPKSEKLEVLKDDPTTSQAKDVDKMISAVFSNLTIADVVAKFEDIAKFYKTREMPRQLAMADMMLDSLGLATFFPALSEATNKALEANNYISSRIEDILAKLRGTMKTRELGANDVEKTVSPEIEKAQKNLEEQTNKDKERKELRKELENKSLEEKTQESPEIEIEEDLGKPSAEKPIAPPAPKSPTAPKPII